MDKRLSPTRIWPLVFSLFSLLCLEIGMMKRDCFIGSDSFSRKRIKIGLLCLCRINHTSLKLTHCFPRLLSSSIRCFIAFAVLWVSRYSSMHLRTWNKPGCSLFCVLVMYSALLMLNLTPQFRHLASTLPGLGIDDTMCLP
jgi:hypothetical protein